MLMDNHLHTNFSDGKNTCAEMAQTAFSLGMKQITFTDHVNRRSEWVLDYCKELRRLQKEYWGKMIIRIGVEAKIINLDGDIDLNPRYRKELDVVLASVHRIPMGQYPEEAYLGISMINQENAAAAYQNQLTAFYHALKNPLVDVLAHPFSHFNHPCFEGINKTQDICTLKQQAENNQKYLEYNTSKYQAGMSLSDWRNLGIHVWIGSDSHSCAQLIQNVAQIRESCASLLGNTK